MPAKKAAAKKATAKKKATAAKAVQPEAAEEPKRSVRRTVGPQPQSDRSVIRS